MHVCNFKTMLSLSKPVTITTFVYTFPEIIVINNIIAMLGAFNATDIMYSNIEQ